MFQTYFSMKDSLKAVDMTVQVPAPTADLEERIADVEVKVPFFENFVCAMEYNETTKTG